VGSAAAAWFFVVNVYHIPEQMRTVSMAPGQVEQLQAEAGEGAGRPADAGQGPGFVQSVSAFFESISYDLSGVTPFLLCWFFLAILINTWRHRSRGQVKNLAPEVRESLPFPASYEVTWIQLGFAGTLWGFLLVGWKMKSGASGAAGDSFALDILLKAFGTALISTFTAVLLAYIFAPLVGRLWRYLYGVRTAQPPLVNELNSMTEAVRENRTQMQELNDQAHRLGESMYKVLPENMRNLLTEMHEVMKRQAAHSAQLPEQLQSGWQNSLHKQLAGPLGVLGDELGKLQQGQDQANKSLQAVVQAIQGLADGEKGQEKRAQAIREEISQVKDRLGELGKGLQELGAGLPDPSGPVEKLGSGLQAGLKEGFGRMEYGLGEVGEKLAGLQQATSQEGQETRQALAELGERLDRPEPAPEPDASEGLLREMLGLQQQYLQQLQAMGQAQQRILQALSQLPQQMAAQRPRGGDGKGAQPARPFSPPPRPPAPPPAAAPEAQQRQAQKPEPGPTAAPPAAPGPSPEPPAPQRRGRLSGLFRRGKR
jgi:uncharacterized protein YoxC